VGRKDSTSANSDAANSDLPSPFLDLKGLIDAFKKKGFSVEEMVALSGSHTIGQAKCALIRPRIYNEINVQSQYRISLQKTCPRNGGDNNLSPLDATTPNFFDNAYYKNLLYNKGLLHSDQQLYKGGFGSLDYKVLAYANDPLLFRLDFANAMVKMGNLSPLTGNQGQIRKFCSLVNKVY
jgi:peroxidase